MTSAQQLQEYTVESLSLNPAREPLEQDHLSPNWPAIGHCVNGGGALDPQRGSIEMVQLEAVNVLSERNQERQVTISSIPENSSQKSAESLEVLPRDPDFYCWGDRGGISMPQAGSIAEQSSDCC